MKEALVFAFCGGNILLTSEGFVPTISQIGGHLDEPDTALALPSLEGRKCLAWHFQRFPAFDNFQVVTLRESFRILPTSHYEMAGKARELLSWTLETRFCSVCGGAMHQHTEISRICSKCGREIWPSLGVAGIVAVTRGDEILLVQPHTFTSDYYGLVAGFVETGETIEACVAREVMEETGIKIRNIRYFGSQPWPYPRNLMVGFTAEYAGGELRLQESEIRKGGWFKRDALPEIPGKVSLARRLIDAWCDDLDNKSI